MAFPDAVLRFNLKGRYEYFFAPIFVQIDSHLVEPVCALLLLEIRPARVSNNHALVSHYNMARENDGCEHHFFSPPIQIAKLAERHPNTTEQNPLCSIEGLGIDIYHCVT